MAGCDAITHSVYRMETSILADKSKAFWGIPWLFRGCDSALPLQGDLDSILGWGTKISQVTQCNQ